jgi:hypothetical protein
MTTSGTPRESTIALGTMAAGAWDHAETPGAKAVARGGDLALDLVQAAKAGT